MTSERTLRERHVRRGAPEQPGYCLSDSSGWPCDTASALALLEAERERNAAVLADLARKVEGLPNQHAVTSTLSAGHGFEDARAAVLRLIREEQNHE